MCAVCGGTAARHGRAGWPGACDHVRGHSKAAACAETACGTSVAMEAGSAKGELTHPERLGKVEQEGGIARTHRRFSHWGCSHYLSISLFQLLRQWRHCPHAPPFGLDPEAVHYIDQLLQVLALLDEGGRDVPGTQQTGSREHTTERQ